MNKILIVCASGMSSSLLVHKMRQYVQKHPQLPYKIGSCASNQCDDYLPLADIIFFSPHTTYLIPIYQKQYPNKKYLEISMKDYGSSQVESILNMIERPQVHQSTKFEQYISKISQIQWLSAITNAMQTIAPISIIGSFIILIQNFPLTMVVDFLKKIHIYDVLTIANQSTIGSISLYLTIAIAYHYAKMQKQDYSTTILNSVICFCILTMSSENTLAIHYFGSDGLFTAMIAGIFSAHLFLFFKKYQPIQLAGLPQAIRQSTLSIIPMLITMFPFMLIHITFNQTNSINQWISLQLTNLLLPFVGNNLFTHLFMHLLTNTLWFFGLHGGNIVGSFYSPLLLKISYANLAAQSLHLPLPYIITKAFTYIYTYGGAGSTLGLCILMTFFAKSKTLKNLGRMTLPTSIFFVNEGILFGLPMVLNPFFILPWIFIQQFSCILTYLAMYFHLIPIAVGYDIPWTTPILITGLIQGGLPLMVWQCFLLLLQILLWYPFFKIYDHKFTED